MVKAATYEKSESLLVHRCLKNEPGSHKEFYDQFKKQLFSTCMRMLNHREEAEDVLQESFVTAFKSLNGYEGKGLGSWLKKIAVNKCIDVIRKRKIRFSEVTGDIADETEEGEFPMDVDKLVRAVQLLPDGYRIIVGLYAFEGFSHAEIAATLGIAESTSRSLYSRAKQKLTGQLKSNSE